MVFALQEERAKSDPTAMSELFGFSGANPILPRKDEVVSNKPKGATAGPGAPGAPSPFGQPASPFGQPASPFGQPASPFGNPGMPSANPFAPK
jgi:hypothetical protein